MISNNIINILKAIYEEYGKTKLLIRIKEILNIDLTRLLTKKTRIFFSSSQIKILNLEDKEKYLIDYQKLRDMKFITLTSEYKKYKLQKTYDDNNDIIRKTIIFKQRGDKVIVLDEIDDEILRCRRIIKTYKEDKDYNNSIFSKEKNFYKTFKSSEKIKRYYDENNTMNIEKTLECDDNLFIHLYKETNNNDSIFIQSYTETLCSLDRPNFKIGGRYIVDKLTTEKSLKTPYPNIYIYGKKASMENDLNIKGYNVIILKNNNQIQIIVFQSSIYEGAKVNQYTINSDTNKEITINDINLLIKFFEQDILDIGTSDVIGELEKIRQKILIKNKKQSEELDFFDLKLAFFDKFEELSYDMFENLEQYELKIQEYLKKSSDKEAKLKLKK